MSGARRWVPAVGVAVTAALFTATNVVEAMGSHGGLAGSLFYVAFSVALLAFPVVGLILVRKYPENLLGWLFTAAGPLLGVHFFSQSYADNYILAEDATGGFSDFTLWIRAWTGVIPFSLVGAFLPLFFPTGRLLSRRWRPVVFLTIGSVVLLAGGSMLSREIDDYPQLVNPYAIDGSIQSILDPLRGIAWVLLALSILLSVVSLIVRFRRSQGIERQQMKWMAFAASFLLVATLSWFVSENLGPLMSGLAFMSLPIAVCVAILRYRLYDIDRIINRTLVYGALTATLVLAYLAIVVMLQGLVPGAQSSDLAVAGSTLAVAALFRPARARIQAFIDRRFYRSKYDAAKTLESFGARLRDEVDLAFLRDDILGVVRQTVAPRHVSLWLRGQETRP